jgi:hypothetical protein
MPTDPNGLQDKPDVLENEGLPIERPGAGSLPESPVEDVSNRLSDGELPEEYKPYQDYLPWDRLPQEMRDEALKGIKKFHASMTRQKQEDVRHLSELEEKSKFLDYLHRQPEIQNALQSINNRASGQIQPTPQAQDSSLSKLSEFGFDKDVEQVLDKSMNSRVQGAVEPLMSEIKSLKQQLIDREVKDQLRELKVKAQKQGLPDPEERLAQMREMISNRRASTVEDAYHLVIQDDLPNLYTERAKKELQEKMNAKAQNTMSPGTGPSLAPQNRLFTGNDAIENALRASEQELGLTR